mmetsp:Transcript_62640/g.181577  ORF Transcript_62640/g.181577 Transcript_62640/m.181577 type:complete len:204 (-) Transcript_62640:745-1356(-)
MANSDGTKRTTGSEGMTAAMHAGLPTDDVAVADLAIRGCRPAARTGPGECALLAPSLAAGPGPSCSNCLATGEAYFRCAGRPPKCCSLSVIKSDATLKAPSASLGICAEHVTETFESRRLRTQASWRAERFSFHTPIISWSANRVSARSARISSSRSATAASNRARISEAEVCCALRASDHKRSKHRRHSATSVLNASLALAA